MSSKIYDVSKSERSRIEKSRSIARSILGNLQAHVIDKDERLYATIEKLERQAAARVANARTADNSKAPAREFNYDEMLDNWNKNRRAREKL